jgi:NADPH:quinone reductase-like Zn-dependent oxidoreductase
LWTVAAGRAELRPESVATPGPDEVRVRALVGAISRGTESLVFQGRVPEREWQRMRCPFQAGAFPFPVKYGYSTVGVVEAGATERIGERIFALHPHQSRFIIPTEAAIPVPADIPSERAVLAPQMETALNATWDAAPRIGDRIAVVGAGVIGILTAYLCSHIPDTSVTLIDRDPDRRAIAASLGIDFAAAGEPLGDSCDLVFHASGDPAGLDLALSLCAFEATVIELSWYGDGPVPVALGGAFHSQRLTIRASQVGSVAPSRRARWTHRRRLAKALSLCADPRLEALVREETPFGALPGRLPDILGRPGALCHLIRYPEE